MAVRLAASVLLLALPAAAGAYQERLILAVEAEGCTLRLEADDGARSLRLRVVRDHPGCHVSREAVRSFLSAAFAKAEPPRLEGTYASLYIGRLIDFPWLASHLASTAYEDRRWDRRRGRPIDVGINEYVATLLSSAEVTSPLEAAMEGAGYRIRSATVEKVLVGGLRDVPGYEGPPSAGKVPFDAQVWFRLEKR